MKSKYRLKPIILGYRLEGYKLQKKRLFWWTDVNDIRVVASDTKRIEDIKTELTNLTNHLTNNYIYIP